MKLPDGLKRAGVLGTGDIKATLRDVAVYSLQYKAGYVPKILPESAYLRQINDERPVTLGASTSQLYRILLGDFQFASCLPEWCLLVAENGMRMPGELIPSMLDSDLVFPDWRGLVLLGMGSYARWIVAHHRDQVHWQWVIQTPMPRLEKIYTTIEDESNKFLSRYEISREKVDFHRRLAGHRYFWTDALAERALDYIEFVLRYKPFDQWRIDLNRFQESFAYYAPLKYHEQFHTLVDKINQKQASDFDSRMITSYRQKLQRIIAEDASKLQANSRGL